VATYYRQPEKHGADYEHSTTVTSRLYAQAFNKAKKWYNSVVMQIALTGIDAKTIKEITELMEVK
jgi:hypothetical protein